jgi:hypothetical protein
MIDDVKTTAFQTPEPEPEPAPAREGAGASICAGTTALLERWDCRRGPLNAVEASKYIADATGLPIEPRTLRSLASVGRGPRCWRGGYPTDCMYGGTEAIDDWLAHAFGWRRHPVEWVDAPRRVPETARWLLVDSRGPDTDFIKDHLEGWGAEVVVQDNYGLHGLHEAGLCAGRGDYDGAIISLDESIEAAVAISEILYDRHLPFLCITYTVTDIPSSLHRGGFVLRRPWMSEVEALLDDRFPPAATRGMRFGQDLNILWNGEPFYDWPQLDTLRREWGPPEALQHR